MTLLQTIVGRSSSTRRFVSLFFVCCVAYQWSYLARQVVAQGPGRDQPQDRKLAEQYGWVYKDLPKGVAEAKKTGKPLLVVIRCPP